MMQEVRYSATEVAAFIAGLSVLITGLGAAIVNIIVALKAGKKADEILVKTEAIAHSVNSTASDAKSKIESLQKELSSYSKHVAEMKETAALLAQALAITPSVTQDRRVDDIPPKVLADIRDNTQNTTDAVKDLKDKKDK